MEWSTEQMMIRLLLLVGALPFILLNNSAAFQQLAADNTSAVPQALTLR